MGENFVKHGDEYCYEREITEEVCTTPEPTTYCIASGK